MAFSFQPKAVTDGMIFCVDAANTKSYPGSGTTATDLSQTAITGSLINGPTFSTDGGGSFLLDGTNDYIDISQNTTYQFTNTQPFTINSWVKCTNTTGYPAILAFGLVEGRAYYLQIDIDLLRSGSFFFDYYDGSTLPSIYRGIQGITGSIMTSSWVNITATSVDNSVNNMKVYQNGILTSFTNRGTGTPTSINYSGIPMRIGVRENDRYFKGNIAQVSIYNRALSATEVLQNYNAICGRFGKTPTITDSDALSFVNAANISNETQQSAINTLVTDLKGAGLWSKMKAIYPFVGGTAASHKWNLKDPRDVDAAFRLTFSGGWTHSSTGADPNGTNAYSNTFLVPNTSLTNTSTHLSIYLREDSNGLYFDIGSAQVDSSRIMDIYARYLGNALGDSGNYTISRISVAVANSLGFYNVKRTANNNLKLFKNGIEIGSNTSTDTTLLPTANVYISAALPGDTNVQQYSPREVAFATIGDGLTDTDAANLYTIVQKYQTTLGRQV